MGFSRQEYWSGLPSPSPGDLPDPGVEPISLASPALQADSLLSELTIIFAYRKTFRVVITLELHFPLMVATSHMSLLTI